MHADAVLHALTLLPLGGRGERALSRDNGGDLGVGWVLDACVACKYVRACARGVLTFANARACPFVRCVCAL